MTESEPPGEPNPAVPLYVTATEGIVVRVTVRGDVYDGQVLGWRGDRVYVSYRTVDGNHLAWLPAADVERV